MAKEKTKRQIAEEAKAVVEAAANLRFMPEPVCPDCKGKGFTEHQGGTITIECKCRGKNGNGDSTS